MIEVTDAAAQEIERLIAEQSHPENSALRLFVQAGGCAGMSYGMEFEQESKNNDKVMEINGVTVFMDPKSYMFLQDITMDFKEGLMGRGFVFSNPNATGQCGCGTSFAI